MWFTSNVVFCFVEYYGIIAPQNLLDLNETSQRGFSYVDHRTSFEPIIEPIDVLAYNPVDQGIAT